jgi:DNA-directed RNA polymerase specialized sigma24 family protein
MSPPSPPPSTPRHAIADYLAGQEARALRFAQTCAPGQPPDEWIHGAMAAFARRARRRTAAQWPALFWAALLERLPAVYWTEPARPGPPARLDHETLHAALRTLAPEQRCAFLLRAWIGLDLDGCAAALGCSRADASEHVYFAVQRLRPLLQAAEQDDGWIGASRDLLEQRAARLTEAQQHRLARSRAAALQRRGARFVLGWAGGMAAAAGLALLALLVVDRLQPPPAVTPLPDPGPPAAIAEPAQLLLALPSDELAMLDETVEFGLLAELDLQLWLLQQDLDGAGDAD